MKTTGGAGVAKQAEKAATRIYIFIDDSNIFIEGQRTARDREPGDKTARARFRIDFGRLVRWVVENRTLADVYLVGSRPPEVDTLWKLLDDNGIRNNIIDRHAGREKGVDHDLVAEIVETSIKNDSKDAVIALIAGDGDYHTVLNRLNRKGWNLEVYFWSSGCSPLIRNTSWYVNMDPHFKEFCFFEHPR